MCVVHFFFFFLFPFSFFYVESWPARLHALCYFRLDQLSVLSNKLQTSPCSCPIAVLLGALISWRQGRMNRCFLICCLNLVVIPSLLYPSRRVMQRMVQRQAVISSVIARAAIPSALAHKLRRPFISGSGVPLALPVALGPLVVEMTRDDLACGLPGPTLWISTFPTFWTGNLTPLPRIWVGNVALATLVSAALSTFGIYEIADRPEASGEHVLIVYLEWRLCSRLDRDRTSWRNLE